MGTNTRIAMRSIAYDEALKNGPVLLNIQGTTTAAYALRKHELGKLFESNGWSTDRIAWLKAIRGWRNFFHDLTPQDDILFAPGAEWTVAFYVEEDSAARNLWSFSSEKGIDNIFAREELGYPVVQLRTGGQTP